MQRDNKGMPSNLWSETLVILYLPLQQGGVVFICDVNSWGRRRNAISPPESTPMVSIKNMWFSFLSPRVEKEISLCLWISIPTQKSPHEHDQRREINMSNKSFWRDCFVFEDKNSTILCLDVNIVSFWFLFGISVWIVSTWPSSCCFWICCVGWLIPMQGEKKPHRSSQRFTYPHHARLPIRWVLCPSRTILVWLMKPSWFRRTQAAQIELSILSFYPIFFQEQCSC